jgi:hypothetical protein
MRRILIVLGLLFCCSVARADAVSYLYYSDSSLLTTFVFSQPLQTYVPETRIAPISVFGSGISTDCTTTTPAAMPGNNTGACPSGNALFINFIAQYPASNGTFALAPGSFLLFANGSDLIVDSVVVSGFTPTPTPEPSTLALFLVGILAITLSMFKRSLFF